MSDPTPTRFDIRSYGLGSALALVVLILCVVLPLIGRLDVLHAVLIGALALARLT